tara:strand:- start:519 stop:767 length:249 start_codon:yes stop_codon:yes gene_type:complete
VLELNILVISVHPYDEVIEMGATIKKLSKTNKICLCVVSEGVTSQYSEKKMIKPIIILKTMIKHLVRVFLQRPKNVLCNLKI